MNPFLWVDIHFVPNSRSCPLEEFVYGSSIAEDAAKHKGHSRLAGSSLKWAAANDLCFAALRLAIERRQVIRVYPSGAQVGRGRDGHLQSATIPDAV